MTDPPRYLVDKSAIVRGGGVPRLDRELCVCPVTRLEVLYSARSHTDYVAIETALDAYRTLQMNAETFAIAQTAQRELAERGEHRISLPDLLIAACAQQHRAGVIHVDRHYATLAHVLDFESVRLEQEEGHDEG